MRNICCIDTETTGLSSKDDYIIQLSAVKFNPETFETIDERDWYVKPIHKYIITEGAFEAHGLTKEFIEVNGRPMEEVAQEFLEFTDDCDFLGYNSNSFDIKMLYKDFQLVGKEFPMDRKFYDSYFMDVRMNPRTLSALYKKMTGKDMEGAHNSLNDVRATVEIFKKQMEGLSYDEVSEWKENKIYSPEGSIRVVNVNGAEDEICFAVGKYKDKEFMSISQTDPGYIKWFMENVASDYTKNILREYYRKNRNAVKK
jgi:DNA polymerase-3 subunit epsilon